MTTKTPSSSTLIGTTTSKQKTTTTLLITTYATLLVGSVSSSLLTRLYFLHGGSSRWLSTLVQSLGFPLLLPLLLIIRSSRPLRFLSISPHPKLTVLSVAIGLLLGLNNFLVSWGISYLPVSTSSLLLSSQLAFTLALSVALVKQPLTLPNLNCVVLLSLSSILLALNSNRDRPAGVTRSQFLLGFLATLGAALLFATYLPIMQILLQSIDGLRELVEAQIVMETAATAFATIGMVVGGGFGEIASDARQFGLGVLAYWAVAAVTVVSWQMCFMATAASVYLTSSLNSGICMTATLTANVVAGVVVFKDGFGGVKAVATAMCVWGFVTYLYGEYGKGRRKRMGEVVEMEMLNECCEEGV